MILGAAVLLGSALAVPHLRSQTGAAAAWPLGALHGLLGLGGLGCLVLALRGAPSPPDRANASFAVMSAALLALAALLGAVILAAHLCKRRRTGALIGLHATLAVSGFVILAAYLFAG